MRSKHILLIMMCSLFVPGCKKDKSAEQGAGEQTAKTTEEGSEQTELTRGEKETPTPKGQEAELPAMAAIVTHEVENFDTWRTFFEAHQEARMQGGILGHILFQDAENPNLIAIYFPATDEAKLDAFVSSPDLKETMAKAGVKGAPTIEKMVPMLATSADKPEGAAIYVEHEVADFDAWKKAYDEAEPLREASGIYAQAVFHSPDDPNMVVVYHEAADLGALRDFMAKPELKELMSKGGVKGEPKVRYLKKMSAYLRY